MEVSPHNSSAPLLSLYFNSPTKTETKRSPTPLYFNLESPPKINSLIHLIFCGDETL